MESFTALLLLGVLLTPPILVLRWFVRAWRWKHFYGFYGFRRRYQPEGTPWVPPRGADPERLSDTLFPGHEHFVVEHDLTDRPDRSNWVAINVPTLGWHGVIPKRDIDPILRGFLVAKQHVGGLSNRVHLIEPGTWVYSELRFPGHIPVVHEWQRIRVRPARADEVEAQRRLRARP